MDNPLNFRCSSELTHSFLPCLRFSFDIVLDAELSEMTDTQIIDMYTDKVMQEFKNCMVQHVAKL